FISALSVFTHSTAPSLHSLSLHDALPIYSAASPESRRRLLLSGRSDSARCSTSGTESCTCKSRSPSGPSFGSSSDDRSRGAPARRRFSRSLEHDAIELEQRVDVPLHREMPLGAPPPGGPVAPPELRVLRKRHEAPRERVAIAGGEQQTRLAVHDQLRDAADVARHDGLAVRHGFEHSEGAVLVPLRRDDEKCRAAYRLFERASRDMADELRVRILLANPSLEGPGPRDAQPHAVADGRMGFEQRDDSFFRGESAEKEHIAFVRERGLDAARLD